MLSMRRDEVRSHKGGGMHGIKKMGMNDREIERRDKNIGMWWVWKKMI